MGSCIRAKTPSVGASALAHLPEQRASDLDELLKNLIQLVGISVGMAHTKCIPYD